jgi:hypothetical protein
VSKQGTVAALQMSIDSLPAGGSGHQLAAAVTVASSFLPAVAEVSFCAGQVPASGPLRLAVPCPLDHDLCRRAIYCTCCI